jgi:hypothetical protein
MKKKLDPRISFMLRRVKNRPLNLLAEDARSERVLRSRHSSSWKTNGCLRSKNAALAINAILRES